MTDAVAQPAPAQREAAAPGRRELLTVDLQGLKAPLLANGLARGLSAGEIIRRALAAHLAMPSALPAGPPAALPVAPTLAPAQRSLRASTGLHASTPARTRIGLRLSAADAQELQQCARQAGLSAGAWVLHLMRTGQAPASAESLSAARAALTASNAELAALSRNLSHLTALLRQGEARAAQQYREALDTAAADIRRHLNEASRLAAQLRANGAATRKPPDD